MTPTKITRGAATTTPGAATKKKSMIAGFSYIEKRSNKQIASFDAPGENRPSDDLG